MKIVDKLHGKRILIWGYGREGKSTENFIENYCNVKHIEVYEGLIENININNYDFIIKSPGIPLKQNNSKIISQTDLFLEQFRERIIGITGTKGKSTTSTLMYHVLSYCLNCKVLLLGNIGYPCLDYYNSITDNTIIIFEMSCHQLAHLQISPHIAVFLNLFQDHLDYYDTFENYFQAKSNIAKYQTDQDFFYVGNNVPAFKAKSKKIIIPEVKNRNFPIKLLGDHNQYNAEVVNKVAIDQYGCEVNSILESMQQFKGLHHRLEFIKSINDIDYYDDSISTTCESTINSINSIPNIGTVLIGGMDRMIDYSALVNYIIEHKEINFICMYESGNRIYNLVVDKINCYYSNNLKEGVKLAKNITCIGKACLLSPAAASYGDFENFECRGREFQKLIITD